MSYNQGMARSAKTTVRHVRRVRRRGAGGAPLDTPPTHEKCWSNAGADERLPVCVCHAGMSDWGPNDHYERLCRQNYALELVLEGSGIVEVNGVQCLLVPGDMLLTHPNDYCRLYTGPARRWRKVYMALQPESLSTIITQLGLDNICHIRLAQTAFQRARKRFASLTEAVRAKPRGFRERVSTLGYELLLIAAQAIPIVEYLERYPTSIKCAMRYAETHLGTPLTVVALAHVVGCSRQYLNSLFNTHLGLSVHEWLTQLRINQACNMLETTSERIAAIAHVVGYPDPFHFSRVFKRMTGVAPQQYRNQLLARRDSSRRLPTATGVAH
jgi:AraC-like DNA-binding protein